MSPGRRSTRELFEAALHAVLLVAILVPVFPGVFLRGEVAISGNTLFNSLPWHQHAPADLAPQNVNLETPRQVVDWYYLTSRAM